MHTVWCFNRTWRQAKQFTSHSKNSQSHMLVLNKTCANIFTKHFQQVFMNHVNKINNICWCHIPPPGHNTGARVNQNNRVGHIQSRIVFVLKRLHYYGMSTNRISFVIATPMLCESDTGRGSACHLKHIQRDVQFQVDSYPEIKL